MLAAQLSHRHAAFGLAQDRDDLFIGAYAAPSGATVPSSSVYLLVFIRILLVHLAEKILLLHPTNFGEDYRIKYGGLIDPLERALIDAVLQKLDGETAGIMRKQLSKISDIYRDDLTRSSQDIFRRAVWLFVRFKSKEKLIPQHESADFAVVKFRVGKENVKAKFSALNGELFAITYSRNVKRYRGSKEVNILSVDTSVTPTDPWEP